MKRLVLIAMLPLILLIVTWTTRGESIYSTVEYLSDTNLAPAVRLATIQTVFTNGMSVQKIISILGTNYTRIKPISTVVLPPGREEDKRQSLWYTFADLNLSIKTSVGISGNMNTGVCMGVGTFYLMPHSFPTLTQTVFQAETNAL